MNRRIAIVLALLLVAGVVAARASNEIAEREGLVCTECHDKPGSKLLTDEGKYYELMGSLEGYDHVVEAFASCTACHKRKPGSTRLTATGRRFKELIGDMQGLRDYLWVTHPDRIIEITTPEGDGMDVLPPLADDEEVDGALLRMSLDASMEEDDL